MNYQKEHANIVSATLNVNTLAYAVQPETHMQEPSKAANEKKHTKQVFAANKQSQQHKFFSKQNPTQHNKHRIQQPIPQYKRK